MINNVLGDWQHPSPFTHGDKPGSLAFLRELRRDSQKQVAKFERMADEAAARVGGFADANRLRNWAKAERQQLADLDELIVAKRRQR